jgi:uncharacterized repeat protein (TIGR03803 family)
MKTEQNLVQTRLFHAIILTPFRLRKGFQLLALQTFRRATCITITFLVALGTFARAEASAGKIIVTGDEWAFSDAGLPSNPVYVTNVLTWFGLTPNGAGKSVLILDGQSWNSGYNGTYGGFGSDFRSLLAGMGVAVTYLGYTDALVPLTGYDAVFVDGLMLQATTLPSDLANFVGRGGAVYLAGGTGTFSPPTATEEASYWQPFLTAATGSSDFGLVGGSGWISEHPPLHGAGPVGAGVTVLAWVEGQGVQVGSNPYASEAVWDTASTLVAAWSAPFSSGPQTNSTALHLVNNAGNDIYDVLATNSTFVTDFKGAGDVTVMLLGADLDPDYVDSFGGTNAFGNPNYLTNFVGSAVIGTGDGVAGDIEDMQTSDGVSLQFDFAQQFTPNDRLLVIDVVYEEQFQVQAYVKTGTTYTQVPTTNWTELNYSGTTQETPDGLWPNWDSTNGLLTSQAPNGLNGQGFGINGRKLGEDLVVLVPDKPVDRVIVSQVAGEAGTGSIQFVTPPTQDFFVVNRGNNTIEHFTAGGVASTFATSGFDYAGDLAFDSVGNLYISDVGNNDVVKYDSSGNASVFYSSTLINTAYGLAFDSADNMFLANYLNNSIVKVSPQGVASVFATNSASTPLAGPTTMIFDSAGNMYVANSLGNTIVRITPSGAGSVFAQNPAAGSPVLSYPCGMAFDVFGNLYVANELTIGGLYLIEEYTTNGVGSLFTENGLDWPGSLAFDNNGTLYAMNYANKSIEEYTRGGVASVFVQNPSGASVLNAPDYMVIGTLASSARRSTLLGPANQTDQCGSTATFTVGTSGTGPFSFQWWENDGHGFYAIFGQTNASLVLPDVSISQSGNQYYVVSTNSSGTTTSQTATLTVVDTMPPVITLAGQPVNAVGALVQGPDGNFYGTTSDGGAYNLGAVYEATLSGLLTNVYSFTGGADGSHPQCALVLGTDGNLYGTTQFAGPQQNGTIFRYQTSGRVLTTLAGAFGSGQNPAAGLTLGSDGDFYGTTEFGGTNGVGTVFKFALPGTVTTLCSFSTTNGGYPLASLLQGSDGSFYGTAPNLGNGYGTVFKVTPAGSLTRLYAFTGQSDGAYPAGALVQGQDGDFYGVTPNGGANNQGTVFQITPSGSLTTLHSFGGFTDGADPVGRLVLGSDGNFYGITSGGGSNFQGTVFQITPAGSLTTFYQFQYQFQTSANGVEPVAGLALGSDGDFYGITASAGLAGDGTVFQVTPSGVLTNLASFYGLWTSECHSAFAGPTAYDACDGFVTPILLSGNVDTNTPGEYTVTYMASDSSGNSATNTFTVTVVDTTPPVITPLGGNGFNPNSGLIPGAGGNFYGTTSSGGTSNQGTVFSISVTGLVTNLYSFTNGADGGSPDGCLVAGADGNFYGGTSTGGGPAGGVGGFGTIFQVTPGGTLTTIYYFTNGVDGCGISSLVQGSDGNLYGTTYSGGTNGVGSVFSLTLGGSFTFTTIYSFGGANDGGDPVGVIQAGDLNLYGATQDDGAGGYGTVFKLTRSGGLTTLYSFSGGADGGSPYAGLTQGTNGNFYGSTQYGGVHSNGTIFEVTPSGALTTLVSLSSSRYSSWGQLSAFTLGKDGNFYGVAENGGTNGNGALVELTEGGVFTTLHSFDYGDGSSPTGVLSQGADGYFYGAALYGGPTGNGVAFKVASSGALFTMAGFGGGIEVPCGGAFQDPGVTAIDACAGNLTSSVMSNGVVNTEMPGVYLLNYSATDPSTNTANFSRPVTVVDTSPPTVFLNGSPTVFVVPGTSFADQGATAVGGCGEAVPVTRYGYVNVNVAGVYTVYYVGASLNGLSATNTRTVLVGESLFDPAAQFSVASDPNGVWTYGYSLILGSPLILYDTPFNLGDGFVGWEAAIFMGPPTMAMSPPTIGYNTTSNTLPIVDDTPVIFLGTLVLHPGPDGQYSVLRFTAPLAGQYDLTGSFFGQDIVGTTTDVHILTNGVAVLNGEVTGYGTGTGPSFNFTAALNAGDFLDFAVGYGVNNNYFDDSTGLSLQIAFLGASAAESFLATPAGSSGLVAEYTFEGNCDDVSGNNNNAVVTNNILFEPGISGLAATFDGSSSYIEVNESPSLMLTGPLTISAWVNPSSESDFNCIVDKDYGLIGYNLYLENGGVQMRISSTAGTAAVTAGNVPLNVWSHVAGVYTGSQILVYVNGTQVGQTSDLTGLSNCSKNLYIGMWGPPGNGRFFQGQMDDILIYNRALSASEIVALASTNLPDTSCLPPPSGLVAWWPGQTNALDVVGGDSGILNNGVSFGLGIVGSAFSFTGTNQAVLIPYSTNTDLSAVSGWTIEAWVNPSSYANALYPTIYSFGYWGASLGLNSQTGVPESFVNNTSPLEGSIPAPLGEWSHLALTYDGTNRVLYINGIMAGSAATKAAASSATGSAIGSTVPIDPDSSFNGLIDEVSIYNRALLPAEIAEIYSAASFGKCSSNLPPVVSAFAPAGGSAGNVVAITGSGFIPTTSVTFNGQPAQFVVQSDSQLLAYVPAVGSSGPIKVSGYAGAFTTSGDFAFESAPACDPAPSGLLGWWPADGNANDVLNLDNGTLENGATFAPGLKGEAFSFDGVSSFVELGGISPGSAWTIEAWVNPSALPAGIHVIAGGKNGCADWCIDMVDGQFAVQSAPPSGLFGGCTQSTADSVPVTPGTWYHVAGTCDGTTAAIYVNGILQNFAPVSSFYTPVSGSTEIGGAACCPDEYFPGLVDELAFYDRALAPAEIAALYNAGAVGKCATAAQATITLQSSPAAGGTVSGAGSFPDGSVVTVTATSAADWIFLGWTENGYTLSTNPVYQFSIFSDQQLVANFIGATNLILQQPASQTVEAGSQAAFTASALSAYPLQYQWYFANTVIPGATNMTLVLTKVSPSQAGNYSFTAGNSLGSVASQVTVLTVVVTPVSITFPANGASFQAPANFNINATANPTGSDPNGIANVIFYTNGVVCGSASAAPFNVALASLPAGSYALQAVATDGIGLSGTSAVVHVTVDAPGTTLIDFEALDASGGGGGGVALSNYLAGFGVTAGNVTPAAASLAVEDDQVFLGGGVVRASSGDNFLAEVGAGGAVSYTLGFSQGYASVSWVRTRLLAGTTGASLPGWRAHVFDSTGRELGSVGEAAQASFADIPAAGFTLLGPGIVSIRFDGNNGAASALSTLPLDDLLLSTLAVNSTLAVSLTTNAAGTVLAAPGTVVLSAGVSDSLAAVTNVQFYEGANLLGAVTPAGGAAGWALHNLAAGSYVFTAVASDALGAVVTSSGLDLAVGAGAGLGVINFDSLDTSGGSVGGAVLSNYLATNGVTLSNVTVGTALEAVSGGLVTGSGGAVASSPPNYLTQEGLNQPVSFTLRFGGALAGFGFTRVGLVTGAGGVSHPQWEATAYDAAGVELGAAGEELIVSATNVPARTFVLTGLNGDGIAAVRFDSDSRKTAAFSAVLLDDLILYTNASAVTPELTVGILSPVNGEQSFVAPADILLSAGVADDLGTNYYVNFYAGPNLVGSVSNSPYNFEWSNVLAGSYVLRAEAVDGSGLAAYSSPVSIGVGAGGNSLVVNFDALDATGGPVTDLSGYLEGYGMSVTGLSAGTELAVENQGLIAGGNAVAASSPPNVVTQIGSSGPVSYIVDFTPWLTNFGFTRPELLANPFVSHPAWTATAYDAAGVVLGQVGEGQIGSYTNVAARVFPLPGGGAGIASVQFASAGTGLTTFNGMVADDFVLTTNAAGAVFPPAVAITNPVNGVTVTGPVPLTVGAAAVAQSGGVAVSFYVDGVMLGAPVESAPYEVEWTNGGAGGYALTAVASNLLAGGLVRTSAVVNVTVLPPAEEFVILTEPASQTNAVGSSANFAVAISGTNAVTYQWYKNGSALGGQTGATLTIFPVGIGDGGTYTVTVTPSNPAVAAVSSSGAVLTVAQPPVFEVQPMSQTVGIGASVALTNLVGGEGPLNWQWLLNGTGIAGATASNYLIQSAQPLNSGNYQVVVGNAVASAASATANLTVQAGDGVVESADTFAGRISINPLLGPVMGNTVNAASEAGDPALIAGKPVGNLIWYTWTASFTGVISLTTLGSDFDTLLGVYTGTNIAQLTSVAEDDDSGGYFTSLVTFNVSAGTAYQIAVGGFRGASGNVILGMPSGTGYRVLNAATGNSVPVITVQPSSQLVEAGVTVTNSVEAGGSGPLSYQWYFQGAPVNGGTGSNLVIANFQSGAVGLYDVLVANAVGSVQSQQASVQIAAGFGAGNSAHDKFGDAVDLVETDSTSVAVQEPAGGGDTRGFSVSQTFSTVGATKETGEPNHCGQGGGASQWYIYTAPAAGTLCVTTAGSTFNTILAVYTGPGTNFASLVAQGCGFTTNYHQGQPEVVIPAVASGTRFYIAVDGYNGASGQAQLLVGLGAPPTLLLMPVSQTAAPGSSVTFTVDAIGSTNLYYQWQLNGANLAGATNSGYTTTNAGSYTVVVSNVVGVVTSAPPAVLTLKVGFPTLVLLPVSQTVSAGSSATFTVSATGSPGLYYQWQLNGVNLAEATNTSYTTTNAGNYTVVVSNAVGVVTSAPPAVLSLQEGPTITEQPASVTVLLGKKAEFSVRAVAPGDTNKNDPLHYQWYFDNAPLKGQTSSNLVIAAAHWTNNGSYYVTISNHTAVATSSPPAVLTVLDTTPPEVAITTPSANFVTTNNSVLVGGTASDKVGVAWVQVEVNTNGFQTAKGSNKWSLIVPLAPGTNLITAQCADLAGNTNTTPAERKIIYEVPERLTLRTSGVGKVSSTDRAASNAWLIVGNRYKVTAANIARSGYLFSNWVSGTNLGELTNATSAPALSFLMSTNLILQANFVTNPFPAVAGTYTGLFAPVGGVTQASSGFLRATLQNNGAGAYSAVLLLDGQSNSFNGTFDLAGSTATNLTLAGKKLVTVHLQVQLHPPDDQMTGTVSSAAAGWNSVLQAYRAVFNATTRQATNYAGQFTMFLPPASNAPLESPDGYSYAVISNSLGGVAKVAGILADGTPISQSVGLGPDGNLPLYQSLYKGNGSLQGWITFTNQPPQILFGQLDWIKQAVPRTLYPQGFTNIVTNILASFYTNAALEGGLALDLTNGTLILTNGNLTGGSLIYTNIGANRSHNALTNLDAGNTNLSPPNHLAIKINPANGQLTVTFQATGAKTNTVAQGAILQNQTNGLGAFRGTTESGSLILKPDDGN